MKVVIENGRIHNVGKNISIKEAHGEFIGALHLDYKWTQALSENLPRLMNDSLYHSYYYEDVIRELLTDLPPIKPIEVATTDWFEVDTLEDLEEAKKLTWLK